MKIAIATPILFNPTSPFNHLFQDIIGGLLDDGNEIVRLVAVEDVSETDYTYGFTGPNISYRLYKRKDSDHGNIISRYVRDSLTNIREAIGILRLKDADVLFEDVSYSSFWPVLAAKCKGMKVVAMLQDVWPDNAVQSQLISEGSILYKYFEMWQRFVYKKADRIVCISDDMKAFIAGKGVSSDKIEVIYNWGYSDDTVNIPWEENEFVKKYDLKKDVFYAVYAGNIGKMQNVEIVVDAAKILQDRKDIHFLIVGDGARKNAIAERAAGLENVTILPMQPSELATHIYSAAGANLISLVPNGIKTAFPSKTSIILSCGRPVICTYGKESNFARLIEQSGSGVTADAKCYAELAEQIERISCSAGLLEGNAHKIYKQLFVRSRNIKKYIEVISQTE